MPIKSPGLSRLLAHFWPQRWVRWLVWLAVAGYFIFAVLVLVLRYGVLPQIENYRGDLETALAANLHLPVKIARIEADWQGLRPRLTLSGLEILDKQNRPALSFDQVQAVLGWTSLLVLEPKLHRLEIQAPQLAVRRDGAGHLFVAGLEIDTSSNEPGAADWVLRQHQVVIRDAAITWTDELRKAPALALTQLNFNLVNSGSRHRFGLTALPPKGMADRFDVRGDIKGSDLSAAADWRGQVYVELDYADLAIWRTWVDYPMELPRGSGGVRLWLDVDKARPVAATADLSLQGVSVRLASNLPTLELTRLQGRLQASQTEDGFTVGSRHLSLTTADDIQIKDLDLNLRWQPLEGDFSANHLDLERLARLAGHLPLPAVVRARLLQHEPRGRFQDLRLSWNGRQQPFEHYRAVAKFDDLAWHGEGDVPGASGISGSLDGSEKGGRFDIGARNAELDLPAVFAESHIPLEKLDVQARWKRSGGDYDVYLDKVAFRNADAEGTANGNFRNKDGQQSIDLDALLSRGEGNAVWKYMPKVVNPDVAAWLKASILSGHAENVGLKLKGDLARFPFTDGSGTFRIQGRVFDAVLNYAPGWPRIDAIQGELLFDKVRMLITANQGNLMGANLGPVTAELPDLMTHDEVMLIKGKAKGDTGNFLKFIEASPVGEHIDHSTQDMSASGNGELDLKLTIPLKHTVDTQVAGTYRFDGNRLLVEPGVPSFEDVRGKLEFTEKGLSAKEIKARSLGGVMSLEVKTQGEGLVAVDARGEATAAALRQYIPTSPIASLAPLFDHVAGSTHWEGTVRVKKRNPEIRIVSDLRGISVSLPEPFNKAATESRPFVFERKLPDARLLLAKGKTTNRELLDVSLGKVLKVQLLRNSEGGNSVVERGFIGLNAPLRLPERGTLLAVSGSRVDADYWRHLFAGKNGKGTADKSNDNEPGIGLNQVDLRVDEVLVAGRSVHDVRVQGNLRNDHWLADVRSREVNGRVDWLGIGKGKLTARISQFTLPESSNAGTAGSNAGNGSAAGDSVEELPALDLTFDHFLWGSKDFGQVKVLAENKGGYWNANFNVQNEDASLSGEGRWKPSADAADTFVDFKLSVKSIEKFLARIGYVNAVKRGNGSLEGKLSWNGPPQSIDYPSLGGNVKFALKDGQFNKLEPGVGRLLGIVSLQSLPRRITLDFRDIFSEGFAFDNIEGTAEVNKGILNTQDLEIKGPAAVVAMQGTVDLSKETQNLKVRVQPALGETVTTGLVLAHPAVGAAYWVANKLFGRPLDQMFAFEYGITGAWADPKVEKLGGPKKEVLKDAREASKDGSAKEATP